MSNDQCTKSIGVNSSVGKLPWKPEGGGEPFVKHANLNYERPFAISGNK